VPGAIDTVSVYLNPTRLEQVAGDIIACHPRRVIFNPGTESTVVRGRLEASGVRCIEACTLVLLRTGQYQTA
jgi:predicted CoA-binding protein